MRMHSSSLLKDRPRRRALLKFLDDNLPPVGRGGRIGFAMTQAWLLGYDTGLKRGKRQKR